MHFLTRPAVSNGLIAVKLKRDLKYMGHAYFEPLCPHIIYQALTYLKFCNKFYEDNSTAKGLLSEDMLTFCEFRNFHLFVYLRSYNDKSKVSFQKQCSQAATRLN